MVSTKENQQRNPFSVSGVLTDVAEQGHEPLGLLFLAWEKAFDKLDHAKMFVTLSRLRMPENLTAIIKSLYRNPFVPSFAQDHCSDWFQQRTGIRQGCPLSPYLFIFDHALHVLGCQSKVSGFTKSENFPRHQFQ